MSYVNSIGGDAIDPNPFSFSTLSISANTALGWAINGQNPTYPATDWVDVSASVGSLVITMPDSRQVGIGQEVVFNNYGANTITINDFGGNSITTITAGQTKRLHVLTNATAAGTWRVVNLGVGTSSADASALAGYGLTPLSGQLNAAYTVTNYTTTQTITAAFRAGVANWTGGAGTFNLTAASTLGNNWYFIVRNSGSGILTIDPNGAETIDGAATLSIAPTETAFICCNGTAFFSIGKYNAQTIQFSKIAISVAGSSDVTLTALQASFDIQEYTGNLTGNINVIVPNTVSRWWVYNNTAGSFTLTVKTAAGTGVVIPQGKRTIVHCDGINVIFSIDQTLDILTYSAGAVGGTADALTIATTFPSDFTLQAGINISFFPTLANTGPATINIAGTGAYPAKKLGGAGLVDLDAVNFTPGIPMIALFDGTQYIVVNLITTGTTRPVGTNQAINMASLFDRFVATAAITLTLARTSTSFANFFYIEIYAQDGAVTLTPDANDTIQNGTMGSSYVIPQGASCKLYTDIVGNWYLNYLGAKLTNEVTLASATTTDLGSAKNNIVAISGTTTITSFGSGAWLEAPLYFGRFTGILLLTHNATSLILPSGANITTAAGDTFSALYLGSGNWRVVSYTRASGYALVETALRSPATQAQMEAASDSTVYAAPSNLKYGVGVAKAGGSVTFSGGATPTLSAGSWGVTSITETATGKTTINLSVTFSSTNYQISPSMGTAGGVIILWQNKTTTSFEIWTQAESGGSFPFADIDFDFTVFGDLA